MSLVNEPARVNRNWSRSVGGLAALTTKKPSPDMARSVSETVGCSRPWTSIALRGRAWTPPAEYIVDDACFVTRVWKATLAFL